MQSAIDATLAFRRVLIKVSTNLSDQQWDQVPSGFNNNIRWQIAHVIASQGLLTYGLAGQSIPNLTPGFIAQVRKGTSPADMTSDENYDRDVLLGLLISQTEQLATDLPSLSGCPFKSYETSTGLVLDNLETAVAFSGMHDGVHTGNVMALRRLV